MPELRALSSKDIKGAGVILVQCQHWLNPLVGLSSPSGLPASTGHVFVCELGVYQVLKARCKVTVPRLSLLGRVRKKPMNRKEEIWLSASSIK